MPRKARHTGERVLAIARELQISDADLARLLEVTPQSVTEYRKRPNANPRPDKLLRLFAKLRATYGMDTAALEEWMNSETGTPMPPLEIPGENNRDTQTHVYYNDPVERLDSRFDSTAIDTLRRHADPRTIRVRVMRGDGSRVWSAKGAQRTHVTVFDFVLAGNRILVKIDGDTLGPERRNCLLAFKPFDQPRKGTFLLCSRKTDPDQLTIRYRSLRGTGDTLVSPDPSLPDEPLGEWDVFGFADYELWPDPDGGEPECHYYPRGVPSYERA